MKSQRTFAPALVCPPLSLCECGCGQETKLSDRTWAKYGMRKGEPLRFLKGHNTGIGHRSLQDRLLAYVRKERGCWLWTGAVRGQYGGIGVEGRLYMAHRVSYEVFVGEIPEGMLVCHTCDVKLCINPAHFFLGSYQDNSDDKVAKDRQARGETGGMTKLTEDAVRVIRRLAATKSYQAIADAFGVHKSSIADILNNRTWIHVK